MKSKYVVKVCRDGEDVGIDFGALHKFNTMSEAVAFATEFAGLFHRTMSDGKFRKHNFLSDEFANALLVSGELVCMGHVFIVKKVNGK